MTKLFPERSFVTRCQPEIPPADWAAIARDYAAGALTVTEICTLHGISPSALYQQANKRRWKKRNAGKDIGSASASANGNAASKTSARGRRAKRTPNLTQRLLTALDQKMTEFENRMADGAPTSAADSERDARTLNTLVRLFDKLKGFGDKNSGTKKVVASAASASAPSAQPTAPGNDTHDADRLRHELAQRLERLGRELGNR